MNSCCQDSCCEIERLRARQAGTLKIVLALNAAMFVVEIIAGVLAGSVALVADSLDMLGDALVYAFSLYVVAMGPVWKVRAALAKAAVMALFGLFVLGQLVYKIMFPELPSYAAMGTVGALALLVNTLCFALIWRHRAEDINMRSVWLCSRNDLVANTSVIAASALVWVFGSPWPDIAVGAMIAALFLRSAMVVTREARQEMTGQSSHY